MNSTENIAQFLFCLSALEEKTFQLYDELEKKVEIPFAKSAFSTLAQESHKHSLMLKEASKGFADVHFGEKDCKKGLGETWTHVIRLIESIKKSDFFESEELLKLAKNLAVIEYSFIEEYSIMVKLKTLQFMSKEISKSYEIDLEKIKNVLETIIDDEESHQKILNELNIFLSRRKDDTNKSLILKFPATKKQ